MEVSIDVLGLHLILLIAFIHNNILYMMLLILLLINQKLLHAILKLPQMHIELLPLPLLEDKLLVLTDLILLHLLTSEPINIIKSLIQSRYHLHHQVTPDINPAGLLLVVPLGRDDLHELHQDG